MTRSLTRDLTAWTLGALVLVWASFIAVGWKTGQHEADELTDGHLASTAALLVAYGTTGRFGAAGAGGAPPGTLPLKAHDYQQSLSVAIWDRQGGLVTRTGDAPVPPFTGAEGFQTLRLGTPAREWRTFSRWDAARAHKVMVLLSVQERDELADDIAGQIIEPGLWVLPVIALVLALAIRRGLRPLYLLTREVHALDVQQPRPLPPARRHEEFAAIAAAIDTLAERFQAALARERTLAGELAHELRTPLASLQLQARAAREAPEGPQREGALARLEADALRAGEVLNHLLALARADRTVVSEPAQQVELVALAQEVLAQHATAAGRTGHELGLVASGPLYQRGYAVLLQLALRNLVENALAHTPPGALIEVRVDPEARSVLVCDTGGRGGNAPGGVALGLGLGHQVVEKIARLHGARFGPAPPPTGFSTAYLLQFP
ncbi:histidine kinase dimerization/phospho-acceptor domain-containing protein [Ramlibacter pallidus]|uniref:histidine kinase n=1 Tax=Ramlibacter pallidus TaxID=2780087 RepID=A0ABR9S0Z4_9BURK|nr:histidine kinase dimerization/phospho-acceptor domain-containing protein [Ramlibacter pallidus]MBE7366707.1 sensor histidine kinase N-terminal domain-containing protein [Ramlibacter pallidus]